jgi:molybdopterin molybdotransferase
MLQLEEAVARIFKEVPAPTIEPVPLAEASGRVLMEGVRSPVDLPGFDNSAMDGYAVRSIDIAAAKANAPIRLSIVGKVAAGENWRGQLDAGTCVRLFTGSVLPRGADAVVMQEDTRVEEASPKDVHILGSVKPWENVRLQGEDIKCGAMLVESGEFLRPGSLSLLAATGVRQVRVGAVPVIGLLATGSELKEAGEELKPGQIYESNRVGLAALIRRAGAVPKSFSCVPDQAKETRFALLNAFEHCDAVVTSGGVSVGEMDLVKSAFEEIDGKLEFWRVAMKPGRPFVFGKRRGKLLFGLPGNPVSALVTFALLVYPALLRWQGARQARLPSYHGILTEPLINRGDRRHFVRVKTDPTGKVCSAGVQASHFLSSLSSADGLVDVPPETTLEAGTQVQVLRLD